MSSETYFLVAYDILAESGADTVTVANLCTRLDITKGSFYYHFFSMSEFVEAFVAFWQCAWLTLIESLGREPDPLRRMGLLTTALLGVSHEAEGALRAWGNTNEIIAKAQMAIDHALEGLIGAALVAFLPQSQIDVRTEQLLAISVGLQQRPRPVDRERYRNALVGLIEATCRVRAAIVETADGPVVEFRHPEAASAVCS